jgi:hypothetical protein
MNRYRVLLLVAAFAAPLGGVGCFPLSAGIFTPIPVPPWVTERMEERVCHKNDFRTPVLPPLVEGAPLPTCEDPPDEARVLRAWPGPARGVPYFYEEHRDQIQIVPELIKDQIDPPRFFPLIGWAHKHICHWKVTIYYKETIESGYPFPYRCVRDRVEVIYMDLDHFHKCAGPSPDAQRSVFRDLTNN